MERRRGEVSNFWGGMQGLGGSRKSKGKKLRNSCDGAQGKAHPRGQKRSKMSWQGGGLESVSALETRKKSTRGKKRGKKTAFGGG